LAYFLTFALPFVLLNNIEIILIAIRSYLAFILFRKDREHPDQRLAGRGGQVNCFRY